MGFSYPQNNKIQSTLRRTRFLFSFTKIFVSDITVTLTQVKTFLLLPFHSKEILKLLWKESGFLIYENKELSIKYVDLMEGKEQ
jgi:hypothetical protein